MILTITPNACVDKTYRVEGFALNRVNRPSESYTVAGGKGINVARVFQKLGGTALATGFLAGETGRAIAAALCAESIPSQFVNVAGESRVCIAVIDPTTGSQTELNETGPQVTLQNARDLVETVRELLSKHRFDFVVLCGSLPPGAPESIYAELIDLARDLGIRSVLDSSGAPFRLGLEAGPWVVKPNLAELQQLLGRTLQDREAVISAACDLVRNKVEIAAVTLGADGAVAAVRDGSIRVWEAVPPSIDVASSVASGDSFLAAFLWQWMQPESSPGVDARMEAALRLGTGAGSANAAVVGAGRCSRESILSAASHVSVCKTQEVSC